MKAIHKGFHQQPPAAFGNCDHLAGFLGIAGQGLFTQNMFAGLKRLYRPRVVKVVGQRNIYKIHLRVNQQGFIIVVDLIDLMLSCQRGRLCRQTCGQCVNFTIA